jgi:hypothetical protein
VKIFLCSKEERFPIITVPLYIVSEVDEGETSLVVKLKKKKKSEKIKKQKFNSSSRFLSNQTSSLTALFYYYLNCLKHTGKHPT